MLSTIQRTDFNISSHLFYIKNAHQAMEIRRVFLLRSFEFTFLFDSFLFFIHSFFFRLRFRFLLFIMKNCCNKNANGAQRIRMHTEQIVHLIDLPGMHFYGTHFVDGKPLEMSLH